LDAENWFSVSRAQILIAGGAGILNYHKGSHIKALGKLYPELILKKENFWMCADSWKQFEKRRKFFDRFARSRNFSPLDAENWYSITRDEIKRAGGKGLLDRYKGSHIKALVKLYPELFLKKENFFISKVQWKVPEKGRKFFEEFAASNKFNPLETEKWYSVSRSEIIRAGGRGLLYHYKGSHFRALADLYPELTLKKEIFLSTKKWKEVKNQRKFFDEFARSKNFNPLDAEKWYSVSRKEIRRTGGSGLLNYYKGSHIKALKKLYPELVWKKGKFQ